MMLTASDLLRPWVLSTLAALATDDEQHARLRETLLVFLHSGGSYQTTASHWLGSSVLRPATGFDAESPRVRSG